MPDRPPPDRSLPTARTDGSRLPRGRHDLTREQVAADQRERILRAMADELATRGFVATTVAHVIARAGVSRETFYQQFRSKHDCFAAAHEHAVVLLLQRIATADHGADDDVADRSAGREDRLRTWLGAYLDALADEPALARVFLIEVYAAGRDALDRRNALQQRFVALTADALEARSDDQRFACEALVAATSALVTARLAVDDLDGLRGLREPLVRMATRIASADE